MAKMNSKFKYMYDAAPESALITKDGVAKTATFNGNDYTLDTLHGYWTEGELADDVFAIAVNVDAVTTSVGDETYELALEFGPAGYATTIKTHTLTITAPGQYAILVDVDTVKEMKDDITNMRIVGTLGGAAPSITAYAWIAGDIVGC